MLPGLSSAIVGAGGVDLSGPIRFVGGAITTKAGAASGTSTMALNSGLSGGIASSVQDGDFVIAMFATGSTADRTLSITDGSTDYTLLGSELYADDTTDTNLRVAYKFVSGDTATTFGASGSTSDDAITAVYVFRGVNQTTPLDVAVTTATAANDSEPDPPSITPTTAGAFIVCIGANGGAAGGEAFDAPADLVDFIQDLTTSTNECRAGIGHKDDWASGAFNAAVFESATTNATSNSWAAMSIALRPA